MPRNTKGEKTIGLRLLKIIDYWNKSDTNRKLNFLFCVNLVFGAVSVGSLIFIIAILLSQYWLIWVSFILIGLSIYASFKVNKKMRGGDIGTGQIRQSDTSKPADNPAEQKAA